MEAPEQWDERMEATGSEAQSGAKKLVGLQGKERGGCWGGEQRQVGNTGSLRRRPGWRRVPGVEGRVSGWRADSVPQAQAENWAQMQADRQVGW